MRSRADDACVITLVTSYGGRWYLPKQTPEMVENDDRGQLIRVQGALEIDLKRVKDTNLTECGTFEAQTQSYAICSLQYCQHGHGSSLGSFEKQSRPELLVTLIIFLGPTRAAVELRGANHSRLAQMRDLCENDAYTFGRASFFP